MQLKVIRYATTSVVVVNVVLPKKYMLDKVQIKIDFYSMSPVRLSVTANELFNCCKNPKITPRLSFTERTPQKYFETSEEEIC